MVGSGIVVEFPTGRPFGCRPLGRSRNRSVVGIVRSLCGRRVRTGADPDATLPIKLSELAGLADETVGRLAALAHEGVITAASAARLAIRHADECSDPRPRRESEAGRSAKYELTLLGDPFGRFAFRFRGRTGWVLCAPSTGIDFLAELRIHERVQACLLIGCGTGGRTAVRILTSADWSRRLLGVGIGRSGSGHVLLLGGLPLRGAGRSHALTTIEQAVRRGGNTELVLSRLKMDAGSGRPGPVPDSAREVLTLIELVFPGLVEAPAAEGGSSR